MYAHIVIFGVFRFADFFCNKCSLPKTLNQWNTNLTLYTFDIHWLYSYYTQPELV